METTEGLRRVERIHPALRDDIGELVTRRPLPGPALRDLDPFLFLNHHGPQTYPPGNRGLPFGPHPHRGFETVTFVVEGALAHRDSGGHESVIGAGGVQWMTAGRGIVHEEVSPADFRRDGGRLEILQLWLNLPSRLKMTEPAYVGAARDAMPALPVDEGEGHVRLVAGTLCGRSGPVASLTGAFLATVELRAGACLVVPAVAHRTIFLYVVRGALDAAGTAVPAMHLAEYGEVGDTIRIRATEDAIVILGHADRIGEPIVAHGPFVMNTAREIHEAIRDYHEGRFGVPLP